MSASTVRNRIEKLEGFDVMDVHRNVGDIDAEACAKARMQDLEVQEKHGVNHKKFWLDGKEGTIFGLLEAPDRETGERVHRESHGLVADEIYEVTEGE